MPDSADERTDSDPRDELPPGGEPNKPAPSAEDQAAAAAKQAEEKAAQKKVDAEAATKKAEEEAAVAKARGEGEGEGDAEAKAKAEAEAKEKAETDAAATKKAEEEAAAKKKEEEGKTGPPEKYELQLPKDSPLGDEVAKERIDAYRAQGLSNKDAQFALTQTHEALIAHEKGQKDALEKSKTDWAATLAKDPEFGGQQFKENAELSKRFVNRFFDADFRTMLENTGMGNLPGFWKGCVRAAQSMKEDTLVTSGAPSGSGGEKTMEEIMYPDKVNDSPGS